MWKEAVVRHHILSDAGSRNCWDTCKGNELCMTLRKLVNAAGVCQRVHNKLMKLVRAKYEHACMVHDRVENVNAFVEKYIYEYRGFS